MTSNENHQAAPAHPSLMVRVGAAAETALVLATLSATWISVAWVLISGILR
jgi:hypothetical protein